VELSENFSVEELSKTDTGLYNTPGELELVKLLYLAQFILQPIRNRFGSLQINSGFRSQAVQEALSVKGYPTSNKISQHTLGEAADIVPLGSTLEDTFKWIQNNLKYGQVILEEHDGAHWIHVSLPRIAQRNQWAMIYKNGIYTNVN